MISSRKRITSILLGLALWFVAAMIVHYLPQMMDGSIGTLTMFAISIPNAFITIWLFEKLVKPAPGELLQSITWGMATALLLDGIGVSFAPSLYAGISSATQYGAALIMFGAGVILLFTMLRDK
jgi:hypothetical protein